MSYKSAVKRAQNYIDISQAFYDDNPIIVSRFRRQELYHRNSFRYEDVGKTGVFSNNYEDSECKIHLNSDYFNYTKNADVQIGYGDSGIRVDKQFTVLELKDMNLGEEGGYFQQSLVYSEGLLDIMVQYWYLNENYNKRFYLDIDYYYELCELLGLEP